VGDQRAHPTGSAASPMKGEEKKKTLNTTDPEQRIGKEKEIKNRGALLLKRRVGGKITLTIDGRRKEIQKELQYRNGLSSSDGEEANRSSLSR